MKFRLYWKIWRKEKVTRYIYLFAPKSQIVNQLTQQEWNYELFLSQRFQARNTLLVFIIRAVLKF